MSVYATETGTHRCNQLQRNMRAAMHAAHEKDLVVPQWLHTANNWMECGAPSIEQVIRWEKLMSEYIIQLLYS